MITVDDFQKAIDLVDSSRNILITTHTRPDGDACGCVAAMCEALSGLGRQVRSLFLSEIPSWYDFLFDKKPAILGRDVSLEDLKQGRFFKPDLVILLDVNSKSQLDDFCEYLRENRKAVLVIDHHVSGDGLGDVQLIDTTAAAAGVIVLEMLRHARWRITGRIARAIFAAIAADTGWFRFTNTDARVYRACAELIDAGAEPAVIHQNLYRNFSQGRFRLMAAMLNSLELHFDGRYAAQYLSRLDFERTGAAYSDTENLIDECRRIGGLRAAALFVELQDGRIRCSLRSDGDVDVREIAQKFGGGGHTAAAGTYLEGPLEHAKELIAAEVAKFLARA